MPDIEHTFDVNHQTTTVFEEPRNQSSARRSIAVVRDREHDGVGGVAVISQRDAVLTCGYWISEGILHLYLHAKGLAKTDDGEVSTV